MCSNCRNDRMRETKAGWAKRVYADRQPSTPFEALMIRVFERLSAAEQVDVYTRMTTIEDEYGRTVILPTKERLYPPLPKPQPAVIDIPKADEPTG